MARDQALQDEAAAWAVRTGDPAFDDWDGFTAWLERDPAHARAYDEVILAVGEAADSLPPVPRAGHDDEPAAPGRRRWILESLRSAYGSCAPAATRSRPGPARHS